MLLARSAHQPPTGQPAGTFLVRDRGALVKVLVDAVRYVEADDNYCTLHTADRRYVVSSSLSALEARLGSPHLVRIHRSYLVDLRRVTSLRERAVQVGEQLLPVGRTHRRELVRRWKVR